MWPFWHTQSTLKLSNQICPKRLVVVGFVPLHPKSTAMVMAGRSVNLTTLFPGQARTSS